MGERRRGDLRARVEARAQEDPAFREALEQDPRAAVEQAFNATVPADWDTETLRRRLDPFFVCEEAGGESRELSESELETASGGGVYCNCACGNCSGP